MNEPTTQQIGDAGRQLCSSALLADALRDVLKLIDDQILVRNTDNDADMRAFLQQTGTITRVLKSAQDALASANVALSESANVMKAADWLGDTSQHVGLMIWIPKDKLPPRQNSRVSEPGDKKA